MLTSRTLLFFAITLAFSLTGQVLLKRGVGTVLAGATPGAAEFLSRYLLHVFLSPYVIAGVISCGIGVVSWMYILSLFEISRALPVLGGSAYIVLFFVGRFFLQERTNWLNFAGIVLIIAGLYLVTYKTPA
jgi:drug/metabolite transporter (DMT)-like permease